jgi:hypothetical protein
MQHKPGNPCWPRNAERALVPASMRTGATRVAWPTTVAYECAVITASGPFPVPD